MYDLVPKRTFGQEVVISSHQMKRKLPLLLAIVAMIAGGVWVALSHGGHVAVLDAVAWLRGAGAPGVALFAALYLLSVLAFVPATWSAAFAGYLYGAPLGLAISLPATLGGAMVAFLVGRFLARDAVDAFAARRPRLRAFDDALADGGYKLVVLLRMCMPHNLLNYGLAASRVRFGAFAIGTMIGGWPLTVLFCLAGSLAANAEEVLRAHQRLGVWPIVLTVVGAIAALAALVWIVKLARLELARQTAPAPAAITEPARR